MEIRTVEPPNIKSGDCLITWVAPISKPLLGFSGAIPPLLQGCSTPGLGASQTERASVWVTASARPLGGHTTPTRGSHRHRPPTKCASNYTHPRDYCAVINRALRLHRREEAILPAALSLSWNTVVHPVAAQLDERAIQLIQQSSGGVQLRSSSPRRT